MLLLGLRGLFCHRFAPNSILLFSVGNRLSKNRLCESTPRATGVSKRGAARSDFRAGMTTVARGASARVRACVCVMGLLTQQHGMTGFCVQILFLA